uniref:Metalloendopeptidase n=1 Tax=Strongyloides stercoralis TaxID=6248 RepID=A0A0K0EAZ9_STRER
MKAIEAIEAIENNTCIKFEKKDDCDNTTQELIFKQGDYCASNVGHIPKNHSQIIWLTPECYGNPYIILHEIGHTLGLIHEHTRTDKDRYVTIDYYSLYENEISNFRIRNDSRFKNYSTAYDYSAIMHYAPYDFSTFWRWAFGYPVIKSKLFWEHSRMMGQRKKMTYNEYKRINLCHCNWCNWVDNSTGKRIKLHTTECKNNFKNCGKCVCPTGYTRDDCRKIIPSDKECGITNYTVNITLSSLVFQGKKKCYIFLKTEINTSKIQLAILRAYAPYESDICTEDVGFQFKYMKDKGTTGLLLCGSYLYDIVLKSESNSVLIFYHGKDRDSFLSISFKQID